MRSGEPNRNSASVLAISVLPVPVGPAKRKTPRGRVGSVTCALIMATRSTRHSMASDCPSTRPSKWRRNESRSSVSRSSRMLVGRPVSVESVTTKSSVWMARVAALVSELMRMLSNVSCRKCSRFPGAALSARYCCARRHASVIVSFEATSPPCAGRRAHSSATDNVSCSDRCATRCPTRDVAQLGRSWIKRS